MPILGMMDWLGHLFTPRPTLWIDPGPGRAVSLQAVALSGVRRIPVVAKRLAYEQVVFESPVRVRAGELRLTFTIRRRAVRSRVRVIREELVRQTTHAVHRYVCAFTAMAADDRAMLARYIDDVPEPAADVDPTVLTGRALAGVTTQLVRMGRLQPASGGAPLIRLQAVAPGQADDGRAVRDVTVVSRVRTLGEMRRFETRLRVFSDDSVIVLRR